MSVLLYSEFGVVGAWARVIVFKLRIFLLRPVYSRMSNPFSRSMT